MDFTEQIHDNLRALIYDICRRLEAWLEPFADDLQEFLRALFESRLPADWRERWHAFVDESAAKGFVVQPQSIVELETWIEAWARHRRLLPAAVDRAARPPSPSREPAPSGQGDPNDGSEDLPRGEPVEQKPKGDGAIRRAPRQSARSLQTLIREQVFDKWLAEAQHQLDEIKRVLDALGDKLDAARPNERIEVEAEVDAVEELIWRYNDALENARADWLRENLCGDANSRLLGMLTPSTFGLPLVVDDAQAERARRQLLLISQRLGERNASMDRIVAGAQIVEGIGTVAGIVAGVGVIYKAAKTGGAWAVVKVVAIAGAAMAGEQAVEHGLRAAGADEQTIRGFRLAVAVVVFIIAKRKSGSAGAEPPADIAPSGNPAAPGSSPPPPTTGNVPAPSNPSATARPAPQGPLKNPTPKSSIPTQSEPSPTGSAAQPRGGRLPAVTPDRLDADIRAFYESIDNNTIDRGVWSLGPAARGEVLHQRLGQNLPKTFPGVDKFNDGVVTSIKSMDIHVKTYRNPAAIERVGQGYVDKVAEFPGAKQVDVKITEAHIGGRELELIVPPGATTEEQRSLDARISYGWTKGVGVRIVEVAR